MLLEQEDYRHLVGDKHCNRGNLFCYVLDKSEEIKNVIKTIADYTGKQTFTSMPALSDSAYNLYGDIERCVYPPVEDWLSAFMEAEMVVTDSFHGTVFSIIFNKPFWVVGNEGRGMARFNSLLSLFGLEDRLITAESARSIDFNTPINWIKVNQKRKDLRIESLSLLKSALK
jgi:exopolysaccharide biosynthesis predicted pyruvyltransferase EpsI